MSRGTHDTVNHMLSTKSTTPDKHLPYPLYFWTVMIIALGGLFDSVYLAISHYRNYADMGYQSFCAISSAINCDTVSQSPYSIFLDIPVPIWGIGAHLFFISMLLYAYPPSEQRQVKRMWTLLMVVAFGFSIYCLTLAGISTFLIHSYCIMCILGYAVCFLLLYFTWLIRRRMGCEKVFYAFRLDINYLISFPKITALLIVGLILMLGGTSVFLPKYWHMNPPELSLDIPRGLTEEGFPWIGGDNPELIITEFADYLCFPCKKNHFHLRRIIQENPDKIHLIHRHFPMDDIINPLVKEAFHSGSAKLAILALYAAEKGKFWEVNDLLFDLARKKGSISIQDVADQTGLDREEMVGIFNSNDLWQQLWKDIKDGLEHGMNGTPGYIINGEVYVGQVPPAILKKYLK